MHEFVIEQYLLSRQLASCSAFVRVMQRRSFQPQPQGFSPRQVRGPGPGGESGPSFGWQNNSDPFLVQGAAQTAPPRAQQRNAGHPQERYGGGPAGPGQGSFVIDFSRGPGPDAGYNQAHSPTRPAGPAHFAGAFNGGPEPRAAQAGWTMHGLPASNSIQLCNSRAPDLLPALQVQTKNGRPRI